VGTPDPTHGKILIDEALTRPHLEYSFGVGARPADANVSNKHLMLRTGIRRRRVVFPGCPTGHPGGNGIMHHLAALVAEELFTKPPPSPQPPLRVWAVGFRGLPE
jgi:hypothetical protein